MALTAGVIASVYRYSWGNILSLHAFQHIIRRQDAKFAGFA